MKLFFLDVETTGLDSIKNDVIQIGGIISDNFKPVEQINFKCQPVQWNNINSYALNVNHTTIDQLKTFEDPKTTWLKFSTILKKYHRGTNYIMAGQNPKFDKAFMYNWYKTHKPDLKESGMECYFEDGMLDLKDIVKSLKKHGLLVTKDNKLGTIIEALNIKVEGQLHDALADIKATANGIYRSLKMIKNLSASQPKHFAVKEFEKWLKLFN